MRKLQFFLWLWMLFDVLAGYAGLVSMPGAMAQIPPGITYVTTQNWSQVIAMNAQNLTAGTPANVTLPGGTAGYVGIDTTSGAGYDVYINDANPEVVSVTGGTYTSSSGGYITFTPYFNHGQSASYTIGSASSGIQETINEACGTSATPYKNAQCNVTIPSNEPK